MPFNYMPIATVQDVPPGTCKSLEIQDRGIALFNLNGRLYALDNTCPHAGGPLGEGTIEEENVTCHWHGWKFHIPTGVCQKNPSPSWTVACYKVRVVDEIIHVALPTTEN